MVNKAGLDQRKSICGGRACVHSLTYHNVVLYCYPSFVLGIVWGRSGKALSATDLLSLRCSFRVRVEGNSVVYLVLRGTASLQRVFVSN